MLDLFRPTGESQLGFEELDAPKAPKPELLLLLSPAKPDPDPNVGFSDVVWNKEGAFDGLVVWVVEMPPKRLDELDPNAGFAGVVWNKEGVFDELVVWLVEMPPKRLDEFDPKVLGAEAPDPLRVENKLPELVLAVFKEVPAEGEDEMPAWAFNPKA